jgi:glycosyltransferase involved in cell wall biosynthesis
VGVCSGHARGQAERLDRGVLTSDTLRAPPKVTVVIPTQGRWSLLRRTLAGALRQRDVEFEIVVVDDGSSDETAERLVELDDRRVRPIRHDVRRHVAVARNAGVAAARGEWIAFLDDDDLWAPNKLSTQLRAAAAQKADFAWCAGLVVDSRCSILDTWPARDPDEIMGLLLRGNWMPAGASNVVARAGLVRELGGFDEKLRHFADWDLWIRLAAAGRGAACPEALVAYVRHSRNMVLTDRRGLVRELRALAAKHRAAADRYGVRPDRVLPDQAGVYRWLGASQARSGRRGRAAAYYLRAGLSRSPYGRRRSMRDAARALRGEVPADRPASIDERLAADAGWLAHYR